jgi:phosphatidylglycerophosphate synthase
MAIEHKGLSMVTSMIAKTKTTVQYIIIIFTLIVLGLKGIEFGWASSFLKVVNDFQLIYHLTFFITLFTALTGLTYLYDNRQTIKYFMGQNESKV